MTLLIHRPDVDPLVDAWVDQAARAARVTLALLPFGSSEEHSFGGILRRAKGSNRCVVVVGPGFEQLGALSNTADPVRAALDVARALRLDVEPVLVGRSGPPGEQQWGPYPHYALLHAPRLSDADALLAYIEGRPTEAGRAGAPTLFVSYRREDSLAEVSRLARALADAMPDWALFVDHSAMQPARSFRTQSRDVAGAADVVMAVIGPQWLDARVHGGRRRRLADSTDPVRVELSEALRRHRPVVILTLEGCRPQRHGSCRRGCAGCPRRPSFRGMAVSTRLQQRFVGCRGLPRLFRRPSTAWHR